MISTAKVRLEYMTLEMELRHQRWLGYQRGYAEEQEKIAARMLAEKLPLDLIASMTQLPVERITELGKAKGLL